MEVCLSPALSNEEGETFFSILRYTLQGMFYKRVVRCPSKAKFKSDPERLSLSVRLLRVRAHWG